MRVPVEWDPWVPGSKAASWALMMLVDGRKDGLWTYRKRQKSDDSSAPIRETRRVLGVIADYAPHLLAGT